MAAAIPGEGRLRKVSAWRAATDPKLQRIERRLPLRVEYGPPTPPETGRPRISEAVRAAYAAVVVVASVVVLRGIAPTLTFASVQAANQAISGLMLLILAAAVGLGLCRVRAFRYACPLMGVWLMISPLFLPGPYSGWVILGGVAAFGVSGWAADAVAFQQEAAKEL